MTRTVPALGRLAALTALGALLLTGCAPAVATTPTAEHPTAAAAARLPLAELELLPEPRAYVGESTATLADEVITPISDAPAQALPATVVSHANGGDREVTVTDTSRVIAVDLAGSIAATVWGLGLGDTLVARDQSTTFPGTEELPMVTSGGHTVNAESVLAMRPTLIITDGSVGPRDVLEQLTEVGIPVVFVNNDPSFTGAQDLAREVGAALGVPEAGEQLAQRIGQQIQDKIAEIAGIAPKADGERVRMVFLYLRGGAGVYYLFGKESGADELIEALGGVDVAGEMGWDGMKPMTDEALINSNPDLILVMTKGIKSAGGVDGLLETKAAIALTLAGQHRRFVDMADGDILSFGPRSAAVLDALARAIYAPDDPR